MSADLVADVYSRLSRQRKGARRTVAEQTVWDIVTVRCQKDMGGVKSVFTDSAVSHDGLVESLERVGERELARAWKRACDELERGGFLSAGRWTGADGPRFEKVFDALDEAVGERLWDLDDALAALVGGDAK